MASTGRTATAVADRVCQETKSDGSRCQARRIGGSNYCFFHDPGKEAARAVARRAGGLKNKIAVLPPTTPDVRLLNAQDVAKLLGETINQVRRGEVDPKVANTLGYLAGILLKSIEQTDMEGRLTALEGVVKRRPDTSEFHFDEN